MIFRMFIICLFFFLPLQAQDAWKEISSYKADFLDISLKNGKIVIHNKSLYSTTAVDAKNIFSMHFGKCVCLKILPKNIYLIITPQCIKSAFRFEYHYKPEDKKVIINDKLCIDIETGILKYLSIPELALTRIKEKKEKELSALRKAEHQNTLLRMELLKISSELTGVLKKLEDAKNNLKIQQQKIKILSPKTIELEKEVSTRIWQKSHYDELIKVAKQNLAYIHEKIKKDGKKFLDIRNGINEDSLRLAKIIIEMGEKQNKLIQIKMQLQLQEKKLSNIIKDIENKQKILHDLKTKTEKKQSPQK